MMTDKKIFDHFEDKITYSSAREIVSILNETIKPGNVVDIGCGIGYFLKAFKDLGIKEVLGIDGRWTDRELVDINLEKEEFVVADLNKKLSINRKFDLLICLEVAEHIDPKHTDVFLDNLVILSDIIVFSAAIPFQGGLNHLNEKWTDYWVQKFGLLGFKALDVMREKIWANKDIHWWYRQNMILFVKNAKYDLIKSKFKYSKKKFNTYVHPELYLKNSMKLDRIINGKESLLFYLKLIVKKITNQLKSMNGR